MRRILFYLWFLVSAISGCFAETENTLCVFGDSYVRNHHCPVSETWHAKAAEQLGLTYHNFGINGNCVGFDRTSEGYGKAMIDRLQELPDSADVVLLIAGHNDAGIMAENADYNIERFSNALDILLKKLKTKYPGASIGYVTPWNVNRPFFAEVISEIRRVCNLHGIPVLDASESIIEVNNPDFRKVYFQGEKDTAHLNSKGHDLFLETGKNFIIKLMEDR